MTNVRTGKVKRAAVGWAMLAAAERAKTDEAWEVEKARRARVVVKVRKRERRFAKAMLRRAMRMFDQRLRDGNDNQMGRGDVLWYLLVAASHKSGKP